MISGILGWFVARGAVLAIVFGALAAGALVWKHDQARLAEAMLAGQMQARDAERKACDALWTAQIEKSNAEAERARADQARRAADTQRRADDEIAALRNSLDTMEKANAALPGAGACGLDRGRVRILPK